MLSDLGLSPVYKQLRTIHKARIIACQEHRRVGDLDGLTDSPQRYLRSQVVEQPLLLCLIKIIKDS